MGSIQFAKVGHGGGDRISRAVGGRGTGHSPLLHGDGRDGAARRGTHVRPDAPDSGCIGPPHLVRQARTWGVRPLRRAPRLSRPTDGGVSRRHRRARGRGCVAVRRRGSTYGLSRGNARSTSSRPAPGGRSGGSGRAGADGHQVSGCARARPARRRENAVAEPRSTTRSTDRGPTGPDGSAPRRPPRRPIGRPSERRRRPS